MQTEGPAAQTPIMAGFPPPAHWRITPENWDAPPFNRWSFRNVRQVLPTRAVEVDKATVSIMPRKVHDYSQLPFTDRLGRRRHVGEALESVCTDAFLLMIDGTIMAEQYFNGMSPGSAHLSQSVSKSIVSALMGVLAKPAGLRLDAPVDHYVPELAQSGYRGASLSHVLDMRSGVSFSEEYLDRESDVGVFERVALWKPQRPGDPTATYDFILGLHQKSPHGGLFDYRSIETEVLGWVLERATGRSLADLLATEIWQPMGAQGETYFTVDRAGTCMASGGFNATAEDYARFGQMMMEEGSFNGRSIVPGEWVAASRRGDRAAFAPSAANFPMFPEASYSRQWWVFDPNRGLVAALGIFGQMILIDVSRRLVAVKLASAELPINPEQRMLSVDAINAIAKEITGD